MNEDQGIALLTHNVGGRGNVSWKLGSAVAYEYQICLPSPPPKAFISQNFFKRY